MQILQTISGVGSVAKVRFHPRKLRFASLARTEEESIVTIWDIESDDQIREVMRKSVGNRVTDIAFHPREDSLVVVMFGRPVEVWHDVDGAMLQQFEILGWDSLAFAPSGEWWVVSSCKASPFPHEHFVRDGVHVIDSDFVHSRKVEGEVDACFAFHPNKDILLAGWNDQGGGEILSAELPLLAWRNGVAPFFGGCIEGLRFSPFGNQFAVIGGNRDNGDFWIEVYDCSSSELSNWKKVAARDWLFPSDGEWRVWPDQVVFSPDEAIIYYPNPKGGLREWEWETDSQHDWENNTGFLVTSLDTDSDFRHLVSGDLNGTICLWRTDWRN